MSTNPESILNPRPSSLSREQFVETFKHIYEHSPWVPERAHILGITAVEDSLEGLAAAFEHVVSAASDDLKLKLIRAHPELAVKPAEAGELTASSQREQSGAGLDRCSAEEYQRFQDLNRAYGETFGFPFIIAVSGLTRAEILDNFERRMNNDAEAEYAEALRQIAKIARIRLANFVEASA